MNKLSSPSSIALIASIGLVAVSMVGFTAYKYMGNAEEERESSFISQRPSSEFILRDTSMTEVDENDEYDEPTKRDLEKVKKANSGHVKIVGGGKRSKKRKRKNKSKKRNTLKK